MSAAAHRSPSGRVIHVVGCVTDEVFSHLGPATSAIAQGGRPQAVVLIDDPRYHHHAASLQRVAQVIAAPRSSNPLTQWLAMYRACSAAMQQEAPHAVHLHGLLPGLVGARALRAAGAVAQVVFSPSAARFVRARRAIGVALVRLLSRPLPGPVDSTAIDRPREDADPSAGWSASQQDECPASAVFFASLRNECPHPLIVTGGRTSRAGNAELLAQLAVLLSGEDPHISFNWVGNVDAAARERLVAANVSILAASGGAERAAQLATGWIFLAAGSIRGFPLLLVEAMATGLPCIALDVRQHRGIIRDGETGFLCRNEREMIERITALVADPSLRARIGASARKVAERRFGVAALDSDSLADCHIPAATSSPDADASRRPTRV